MQKMPTKLVARYDGSKSLLDPLAIVQYKARSSKEVSIRPLISSYTVLIKAFVFVLKEVSEPSQAS